MIDKPQNCTILSPTAILGYGFPESSFFKGLSYNPDVIAVDGGSTDPGPYYLGAGKSFTDRSAVKRDLRFMIRGGFEHQIPVIIGTAGGCGAKVHVQWCRSIIEEILREEGISCRLGIIHTDVPKEVAARGLESGHIQPLGSSRELTEKLIYESSNIVAQIGEGPIIDALNKQCDIVLAGRAYDPACFAAVPIRSGFDPGLSLHAGKILECAAIAADPGSGSDCALGIVKRDCFSLRALSSERSFTRESTCAHTLYEKSNPYLLPGPGGTLDLSLSRFTETEDGVDVSGSRFIPSDVYRIKLEGARAVGYRTLSIAATRDPVMIADIDSILLKAEQKVRDMAGELFFTARVHVHQYGRHGVMGPMEPFPQEAGHEIALLIDAVGETQQQSDALCSMMRSTLLHFGYEGRISTAGNLAFPFSPSDIPAGRVYEFSLYHLLEIDEKMISRMFPVEVADL